MDKDMLKVFALDRMSEIRLTRKSYTIPKGFRGSEYFKGYFGIVNDGTKIQTVKMKVWSNQRDYFKTLPLNSTMVETEVHEDWSIFECEIAPTWELEMELLQYHDTVEVLEPTCLRDMMIEHAWNMLRLYKEI